MKIIYKKTSSRGNCSVIESESGNLVVIDAGIKYKNVDKEIGYRLHKADALLITHYHKDHTHYFTEFCKSIKYTYTSEDTIKRMNIEYKGGFLKHLKPGEKHLLNGFIFLAVEMVHTNSDRTDCECYGFLLMDKSSGEKLLWATDTQYIKNKFPPLDFYCIECNFFERENYNSEISGIEKVVEQRRVKSHMSFESCVKFLKMQDLSKCKEIHLLHISSSLSEEDKKKMKRKLRSKLRTQIFGREVKIYV